MVEILQKGVLLTDEEYAEFLKMKQCLNNIKKRTAPKLYQVFIDDNLVKTFTEKSEAVDFKFTQYAILGQFQKDAIEIKEVGAN